MGAREKWLYIAYAQSTATIGLTIRDNATHPLQAQGQTFFNGHRSFHTIAVVAITYTQAQGDAAIPTHAQTEEHLFEVVPPVFAMPVGRSRRPWRLLFVLIGPIAVSYTHLTLPTILRV